jgi:transcriptional accessory protein Tex/SPT6
MLRQFHCHLDNSIESMKPIDRRIAEELGVRSQQVAAAIALLDSGATVPFVARYRKEATGSLDDTQLRRLEERLRAGVPPPERPAASRRRS